MFLSLPYTERGSRQGWGVDFDFLYEYSQIESKTRHIVGSSPTISKKVGSNNTHKTTEVAMVTKRYSFKFKFVWVVGLIASLLLGIDGESSTRT